MAGSSRAVARDPWQPEVGEAEVAVKIKSVDARSLKRQRENETLVVVVVVVVVELAIEVPRSSQPVDWVAWEVRSSFARDIDERG